MKSLILLIAAAAAWNAPSHADAVPACNLQEVAQATPPYECIVAGSMPGESAHWVKEDGPSGTTVYHDLRGLRRVAAPIFGTLHQAAAIQSCAKLARFGYRLATGWDDTVAGQAPNPAYPSDFSVLYRDSLQKVIPGLAGHEFWSSDRLSWGGQDCSDVLGGDHGFTTYDCGDGPSAFTGEILDGALCVAGDPPPSPSDLGPCTPDKMTTALAGSTCHTAAATWRVEKSLGKRVFRDLKSGLRVTEPARVDSQMSASGSCPWGYHLPSCYPPGLEGQGSFPRRDSEFTLLENDGIKEVVPGLDQVILWSSTASAADPAMVYVFVEQDGVYGNYMTMHRLFGGGGALCISR